MWNWIGYPCCRKSPLQSSTGRVVTCCGCHDDQHFANEHDQRTRPRLASGGRHLSFAHQLSGLSRRALTSWQSEERHCACLQPETKVSLVNWDLGKSTYHPIFL